MEITEKTFWEVVKLINWQGRKTNTTIAKKQVLKQYNTVEAVEKLSDIYSELRSKIEKKVGKHATYMADVEGKRYDNDYGGDSWSDMLAEIVGKGEEFYNLVLEEPMIAFAVANQDKKVKAQMEEKYPQLKKYGAWNNYTECFSYCLPYKSDVEDLNPETWIRKATECLEGREHEDLNGEIELELFVGQDLIDLEIQELQMKINSLEKARPKMAQVTEALTLIKNFDVEGFKKVAQEATYSARELTKDFKYGGVNLSWYANNLITDFAESYCEMEVKRERKEK